MNNNWLGFSLSPQQHPSPSAPPHHHRHTDICGSGECFDLTSDSTPAAPPISLNHLPPASFGALEAFTNSQCHDWNMKGLEVNPEGGSSYKSTTDLSMLMGNSCNTQSHEEAPKLENFLGDYLFQNRPLMQVLPSDHHQSTTAPTVDRTCDTNGEEKDNISNSTCNGSMGGLSMMKCWLRKQQTQLQENKNINGGGGVQSLSLSIMSASSGSHSGSPLPLLGGISINGCGDQSFSSDNNIDNSQQEKTSMGLDGQTGTIEAVPRKSIDAFGQRTSIYRGVTRHRWTGRYEAHLWDNSCRREGQTRKGRQVYLGGYDKEEKAARAYDLAALKYWGSTTTTNFPISNYEKEVEEMKHMTRQEYVASLRRKSSGFSRGASIYRGVTRHHQHGRWQARIGRVAGNKDLYLGTFGTQEEAAEAYDIAAIKFRGLNAVTNFDMSRYDVKSILENGTLPVGGGAAKRLKDIDRHEIMSVDTQNTTDDHLGSQQLTIEGVGSGCGWPASAFQQQHHHHHSVTGMHYPSYSQKFWCKQEFQDVQCHQLQLGNGIHNFFQPSSASHNLMSMDPSSMEHSSGSNSTVFSNGGGGGGSESNGPGIGYGSNNSGRYMTGIPMATVTASEGQGNNGGNIYGEAGEVHYLYGSSSSDPYDHHTRNLYYQSMVGGGVVRAAANVHEQCSSTTCNSWVPTVGPSSNNMAVCPGGAPTLAVWNDT